MRDNICQGYGNEGVKERGGGSVRTQDASCSTAIATVMGAKPGEVTAHISLTVQPARNLGCINCEVGYLSWNGYVHWREVRCRCSNTVPNGLAVHL